VKSHPRGNIQQSYFIYYAYIEETKIYRIEFKFIYWSEAKYIKIRVGYFPRRAISHDTRGQIFLHDRVSVRLRSYDITSVRWKMHYIDCSVARSTQSFPRKCDDVKVDLFGTIILDDASKMTRLSCAKNI